VGEAVQGRDEQGWLRQPEQHGSGIIAMMEYIATEQTYPSFICVVGMT